MFPLICSLSFWRSNSQTSSSHSDLPMVQVKCQPYHSPNNNKIKPNYFFHGLQPKALEQLSRKTMAEERRIFPVSKYMEYFPVIPFCHLIRRTKGLPLFQASICIYNNALPWQNLIVLDFFLGGIRSLQEYKEGKKNPAKLGASQFSSGMGQVPPGPFQELSGVGQRQPGCVPGNQGTESCRSCLLSPPRAGTWGIKEGTDPPHWGHSRAACSQIL